MNVLRAIFPRFHADESQCEDPGSLENARMRGEIVPRVDAAATGSFTAPRAQETLYLVAVGECFASHAENWGTKRAVVFREGRVVADGAVDGSSHIARIADFDGNGLEELVIAGGFTNQGAMEAWAAWMEFRGASLATIADFGIVLEDTCGIPFGKGEIKYSIIHSSRSPGNAMNILREPKTASCR